jgi:putative transposase
MVPARRLDFALRVDGRQEPVAVPTRVAKAAELTSQTNTDWCTEQCIEQRFIRPGKPDQSAYIERFNLTYREVVLSANRIDSLDEVREIPAEWLARYGAIRLELPGFCGELMA